MLTTGTLASETALPGVGQPYGLVNAPDGNFYIGDQTKSQIAQVIVSTSTRKSTSTQRKPATQVRSGSRSVRITKSILPNRLRITSDNSNTSRSAFARNVEGLQSKPFSLKPPSVDAAMRRPGRTLVRAARTLTLLVRDARTQSEPRVSHRRIRHYGGFNPRMTVSIWPETSWKISGPTIARSGSAMIIIVKPTVT